MDNIEILEKRWKKLHENTGSPKSEKELEEYYREIFSLAKEIEIERAKEYQGLIHELAAIDIKINSICDLVNTKSKYPKAIPLLMKYLPLVSYHRNKEGIIRSLTVPEAKGQVVPLLINEYLKLPSDQQNLKWVIGNAVNVTITKNQVNDILPIVLNTKNGYSREMFVSALGKAKSDIIENILIELLNDDDPIIVSKAITVLGRKKSKNARQKIEALSNSQDKLVSKAAIKVLKKFPLNAS